MKTILMGLVLAVPLFLVGCDSDDDPAPPAPKPTVSELQVQPKISVLNVGTTGRFEAIAVYSDGTVVDVSNQVVWSLAPGVQIIESYDDPENPDYAYAIATQVGENDLFATLEGQTSSAKVRVYNSTLTAIAISPAADITMVTRESTQLKAIGTFSDGRIQDLTNDALWSVSGPSNVLVTNGLVYSELPGVGIVGAAFGSAIAEGVNVVVIDPVDIISIAFEEPTTIYTNNTEGTHLKVMGTLADGTTKVNISTTTATTWLSTSDTIASFPFEGKHNKGKILGHEAGTATVQVTFNDLPAVEQIITVLDDGIAGIAIDPAGITLEQAQHVHFKTILTTLSGGTYEIQDFELHDYTVADNTIATFGLLRGSELTAIGAGTTTINATYTDRNGNNIIAVPVQVTVSPALAPPELQQ